MKTSGTPSQKVSLTQLDPPKEETKVNIEETRDTLVDSDQSRVISSKEDPSPQQGLTHQGST